MSLLGLKEREYQLERINMLKKKHPEVSHMLDLLTQTTLFQKKVYEGLKDSDWKKELKKIYKLFELCAEHGSDRLREKAIELERLDKEELHRKIEDFLREKDGIDEERFLFLTFLNPFFAKLGEDMNIKKDQWLKNRCPVCGFKPSLSHVMDSEDTEGSRYLSCVLCNTQWLYNRTSCVRCGNNEDNTIDYFYYEGEPYAQLQACRKCNTYMKIIDMRIDGLSVPYVDDIATLYLDLWAKERGYLKFERNILGI